MEFEQGITEDVYQQNYQYYEDDSWEDTARRVTDALLRPDEDNDRYSFYRKHAFEAVKNRRVLPSGRNIANSGTDYDNATNISCFVSGATGRDIDSIEGIMEELTRCAKILASEGGYGFNADFMRPRGSIINGTGARTPGAVEMLNLWDQTSATLTKGPQTDTDRDDAKEKIRKGAMMVTMATWHPDIEEFIEAKQEQGRLSKFNMSVLVPDSFMKAVRSGDDWELVFPNYEAAPEKYEEEWNGAISDWDGPTKTYKTVNAQSLWDKIMKCTYGRNEPGVLFYDNINDRNPLWYEENIKSTNPCCFAPETKILTDQGYRTIKELAENESYVGVIVDRRQNDNDNCLQLGRNIRKTGVRDVYRLTTKRGYSIRVTNDHAFYTEEDGWVEAQNLEERHRIHVSDRFGWDLIESFEFSERTEVYDLEEPKTHSLIANGFVAHNSEWPMTEGGVCNLINLVLPRYLMDDGEINWNKMAKDIHIAVRMADNVNDITYVPFERQRKELQQKRRIGLGHMGFGSLCAMRGIEYGSDESLALAETVQRFVTNKAYQASAKLAREKEPFPLYDEEKHKQGDMYGRLWAETRALIDNYGLRNSHLTSIQPTGNTSVLAGNVSSGIEPIFAPKYTRTVEQPHLPLEFKQNPSSPPNEEGEVYDSGFRDAYWCAEKQGDELVWRMVFNNHEQKPGREPREYYERWQIHPTRGIVKDEPVMDYAVSQGVDPDSITTAMELSVADHVSVLKKFATHVDAGISKTVNVPEDYPFDEFKGVYESAWETGVIKGVSTYRKGTMSAVLSTDDKESEDENPEAPLNNSESQEVCPECGSKDMKHEEGCVTCLDCGNSKCEL